MSYQAPASYHGTGSYGVLTEAEQATYDEYTNLRAISDWPGYDADQDQRRADARQWILDRMDYLAELAAGLVLGEPAGWETSHRGERYDYLSTLNSGSPKHEVRLPCPGGATDAEKVHVEEREVYLAFGSQYEAQKQRKLANLNWLQTQRKQLWHLGEDEGWNVNNRDERYDALCIATSHGSAYEGWQATHNKWGEPYTQRGSAREEICDWLDSYLGVHENPDGSNAGQPQPSGWQQRVYGDDGVPWCACFAVCSAWDAGITGTGTAGVWNNTELAKQGAGIYRGYTTDPAKIAPGDHAFIGSDHTGVVYDVAAGTTVEGNTSDQSAWNGGTVAKKSRGWGYWTGFGLVRADD